MMEVYNCDWVGARRTYNWYAISTRIGNVLVDSCTFIDNKTTGYGHFCTAIMAHKNSSFSDITVKRCTFDGNINSGNVHNGNAAAIITSTDAYTYGSYAIAQLNNVHFYCNTYVKSGDTLYGVEEESCVRYVSLTSDKTILSYKDQDSCILSASVTNIDNDAVPNQSVDFYINNVLIGTGFTDKNGIATCTYESTGAGEIEFIASCRDIVSEIYSIEDCDYWNEAGISYTSTSTRDTNYPTGIPYSFNLSSKFEYCFDMQFKDHFRLYLSSENLDEVKYGIGFNRGYDGTLRVSNRTTSTSYTDYFTGIVEDSWHSIRAVFDNGTWSIYFDEVFAGNITQSWWSSYNPYVFRWAIWDRGTVTAKNIKIKAL